MIDRKQSTTLFPYYDDKPSGSPAMAFDMYWDACMHAIYTLPVKRKEHYWLGGTNAVYGTLLDMICALQ